VYRRAPALVQPVQPPAPRIIQNTVHQTVVHLHQTTHQHILNRLSAAGDGRGSATLLVRQTVIQSPDGGAMDVSRPTLAARRMLRILSTESARQTLRPFYQQLFRELLIREREEYGGRPVRSLLLVRRMLGRRQTLTTLRRFYCQAAEKLEGSILHSLIYRRYARHIQQDGGVGLSLRYTGRELAVPEDLRRLPAARRAPLFPRPPECEPNRGPAERRAAPAAAAGLRLSAADFQALVRGVADALGRQGRLRSLRRGGM